MSAQRTAPAILILGLLLGTAPALALSNRVFVSTTGNDANDCSNPLTPCIDFAGALSQVAAGGEIIAEATGAYGPLNITKSVTISGPPGVVIYSGHQVTVNAPGSAVVLKGLTIDGNGAAEHGINVVAANVLVVDSCIIANFSGMGGTAGNGIHFKTAGILGVRDTAIRHCGHNGIIVALGANGSFDHVRLEGNGQDSGFGSGLLVGDGSVATIRDSVVTANVAGLQSFTGNVGTSATLNVENCMVTLNATGILAGGAPTSTNAAVLVSNSTITNNNNGVSTQNNGQVFSRGNNTLIANSTDGVFSGPFPAK